MESRENIRVTKIGGLPNTFSRRNFLKGAAALTAAANVRQTMGQPFAQFSGQTPTGAPWGTVWLYISTYTGAPGLRGSSGMGIYLCELNLLTGKLTVVSLAAPVLPATSTTPSTASPSSIFIDPTGTHLYAGNEYGPPGAVSAYAINRATGALTYLNGQPAVGAPAYVGVDKYSKYLFSAEYTGSYFEVFPILANGSLGPAVFQKEDVGDVGPTTATDAPPGSFAISGHDAPHPHMAQTDPSNKWVLQTDLGQDRIYVWKLTPGAIPPLTPAAVPFVNVPPGDGARHFAFHPNGTWMYSIQEEASTIMFWLFDPDTGSLSQQQIISCLPPGFAGTDLASEIRVSGDGNFVYGANRTSDTIGVFSVGDNGRLAYVSHASTLGDYPRTFAIDPTGQYLAVDNQYADNATAFKINRTGDDHDDQDKDGENRRGSLVFTGSYAPVGSPSGMAFLI